MTRSSTNRRSRNDSGSAADSSSSRPPKVARHRYYTRSRAKRAAKLGGDQEGRNYLLSDEELRSRTAVLKPIEDKLSKALGVSDVELNKDTNGVEHRTSEYELSELVVRRGQAFTLTVVLDRAPNVAQDHVVLQVVFGSRPQENKGTLVRIPLDLSGKVSKPVNCVGPATHQWSASTTARGGDNHTLDVSVVSPPNAAVGKYGVFVETALKADKTKSKRRFEKEEEEIYLIFNPWCQDDVCFMAKEEERYEYVLNDMGRIWVGSAYNNQGRPWNFGQFDNPVLEAALHLMDLAEVGDPARKSPVAFIRAVSALANSCDDDGVLEGRWTEKYPKDCTLPWAWTGSVKIIEQFMRNGTPVQFGQCWVFSGLVTSLLRSLGIPTRSVTNFESAHDTDCSMTIDSHFDEDDEPITWRDDSVWNFHVWNESYFRRVDLPKGYDGWQAHDATPQETSEGVMRCGPAPVKAIKEGHVYLNYDTPFIFSEVNGDKVTWKVSNDGDMEMVDVDTHAVGKNISTKAVGGPWRHDLTGDYKYPEGSPEERKVVAFANQHGSRAELITCNIVKDVDFHVVLPENAVLGEDFKLRAHVKNNSTEMRHIYGRLTVLSSFYTGVPGKRIKGSRFDVDLVPGQETDLHLEVSHKEYLDKLNPEASLQVYASLNVSQTPQKYARSRCFALAKPFLDISLSGDAKAATETAGVVKFTNPLPVNLTGGSFNLEGAAVMSADTFTFSNPIKPGEEVSYKFKICPRRAGTREIAATFSSDQLSGVDGSVEFTVLP